MSRLQNIKARILTAKAGLTRIPKQSWWTVIIPLILVTFALQIVAVTAISLRIDQKIFHPMAFWVRHYLKPQKLDPRIKIFAYDNRTAAYQKALDIPLETWATVLSELSKKNPAMIFVDKLFDNHINKDDIQKFSEKAKEITAKTCAISFTFPGQISFRQPIPPELLSRNESRTILSKTDIDGSLALASGNTPYGATAELLSQFTVFGHAEYRGDHRLSPLMFLGDHTILPHAALTMADKIEVKGNNVFVNGHNIHVAGDGKILIDFAPKTTYAKLANTFLPVIERAKNSQDLSIIKPGDYVIILPSMYTGSTDFVQTPFGAQPGGFHIVALLQSILTGEWLRELQDPGLIVTALGLLGFLIGFFYNPSFALLSMFAASASLIGISMASFVWLDTAYSFVLPVSSLLLCGLGGIVIHSSIASIEEHRIERELEVATLVQKAFFPSTKDTLVGKTNLLGHSIPASECGGDWWGSFQRQGYTYIMLGDAIGHGVPAALVTAVAFSATRILDLSLANTDASALTPSIILAKLNKVLCDMNSELASMTFFILRIHDESGECVFANAGNPQPVLIPQDPADPRLTKGQRALTLLARGDVLGLSEDSISREHQVTLTPGDRLILYTDGLVENILGSIKQTTGKSWLKQILVKLAEEPADSLAKKIWDEYTHALGDKTAEDDVTVVVISRE